MKLRIVTRDPNYFGLQMFDALHAYSQSQSLDFKTELDIEVSSNPHPQAYNILFLCMPNCVPDDYMQYDMVIVDNVDESTDKCTDEMSEILSTHPNSWFFCNSILGEQHKLYGRTISGIGDWQNCIRYWTSTFYPQKYQIGELAYVRKPITYINGLNRTWRKHILDQITIPKLNNISDEVYETTMFREYASDEDIKFYNFLRDTYPYSALSESESSYYDNSVPVGVNSKFGKIPPGYFSMPEYKDYAIIAFPETSWRNDELFLSEKILKCFVFGAIPMPIGGANIHKLYHKLGFITAHDFLPDELKFDSELDHIVRHQKTVKALEWLQRDAISCYSIVAKHNQTVFYQNKYIETQIKKLHDAIVQK
jgi:hypothetical protein